jgi:hypothetical protein
MRPLVAHCHLGLGKLNRRTGKREQAREHLTTATTMYREMDMRFLAGKVGERLRRGGGDTEPMKRTRGSSSRVTGTQLEKATYGRGDYGRMVLPDGSERWWVRSPEGSWLALPHERVMQNDDGSITLLSLQL